MSLFAVSLAGTAWATWNLGQPADAFSWYLTAITSALVARSLYRRTVHRQALRAQWLDLAWLGCFWLLMAVGLVVVVNGRLPFLGHALEDHPRSNVATDLGNSVLGGLIVGAMLILLELAQRRRESRAEDDRRSETERSDMLLFLGLERDLRLVDLSDRDLSWFSLRKRDLSGARLRRTCLFRANLERCDLTCVEFDDADLTNVFLADAIGPGAIFKRANLDYGHLQRIDLQGANLWGASIREAKLEGADLSCADLRAVDLRGSSLDRANLEGARYNSQTLLPHGFDPTSAGMTHDETPADRFTVNPTGTSICADDHDADRAAWDAQQGAAAASFADRLNRRVSERATTHFPARAADMTET